MAALYSSPCPPNAFRIHQMASRVPYCWTKAGIGLCVAKSDAKLT